MRVGVRHLSLITCLAPLLAGAAPVEVSVHIGLEDGKPIVDTAWIDKRLTTHPQKANPDVVAAPRRRGAVCSLANPHHRAQLPALPALQAAATTPGSVIRCKHTGGDSVTRPMSARKDLPMPALSTCHACDGFLPPSATTCPHCDTTATTSTRRSHFARFSRALFGMAGSGAVAVTLMACYGAGAMRGRYARPQPPGQCQPNTDMDHDGACQPEDCNDNRRDIHPGAPDNSVAGVDQNCDGTDGPAPPPARATPLPSPPPAKATPPASDSPAKATSP